LKELRVRVIIEEEEKIASHGRTMRRTTKS